MAKWKRPVKIQWVDLGEMDSDYATRVVGVRQSAKLVDLARYDSLLELVEGAAPDELDTENITDLRKYLNLTTRDIPEIVTPFLYAWNLVDYDGNPLGTPRNAPGDYQDEEYEPWSVPSKDDARNLTDTEIGLVFDVVNSVVFGTPEEEEEAGNLEDESSEQ